MLVITRKKGESILLGEDIEVTVVKIDDSSIKLSIEAPKNVRILRKELYEAIKKENQDATEISDMNILKSLNKWLRC